MAGRLADIIEKARAENLSALQVADALAGRREGQSPAKRY
jgi:hypothetical protein